MSIILTVIILLYCSVSWAIPIHYDPPLPYTYRQITVKVKNTHYAKMMQRRQLAKEIDIEKEIQRLEKEERRQNRKATINLMKELSSLNPIVTIVLPDGKVESKINMMFVRRILYPDKWNKG